MEEIGYRTDIFTLDGITSSQREYIQWLLKTSTGKGKPEDILTTEAVDLLAMKLRTPLQVQLHLTLALEAGYQTGEKPITTTLVESVLSRQLDDLEPTLIRHDYRFKDMVDFNCESLQLLRNTSTLRKYAPRMLSASQLIASSGQCAGCDQRYVPEAVTKSSGNSAA